MTSDRPSAPAPRIYLDHNASAPLVPAARAAVIGVLDTISGNPSSVHGFGQLARAVMDRARQQVAAMLGAEPAEIVFTSGATEANVLAVRGVLPVAGGRLVTTAVEHPSLLAVARQVAVEGAQVTCVGVAPSGLPDTQAWTAALQSGATLASAMAVNNELGVVSPLAALAESAHAAGALFHVDLTQAVGRIPLNLRTWGVDLASLSGHKLGAPAGVGVLWVRRGVIVRAVQGGHQEQGLRAGTENLCGIAGLGAAATMVSERLASIPRQRELRDQLWQGLRAIDGCQRHGEVDAAHETGQTLNVRFAGVEGASLLMALDLEDIAVSSGAACASGSLEPSHVLLALGEATPAWRDAARGAVRFSLGPETSAADIDRVLAVLPALVARIRAQGKPRGNGRFSA